MTAVPASDLPDAHTNAVPDNDLPGASDDQFTNNPTTLASGAPGAPLVGPSGSQMPEPGKHQRLDALGRFSEAIDPLTNAGHALEASDAFAGLGSAGGMVAREAQAAPGAVKRGLVDMLAKGDPAIPEAIKARKAGFTITPREAVGPEGSPSAASGIMSTDSGKVKLQQFASVKNQPVVQSKAAVDLGLPPQATLTPANLEKVRAREGQAYAAVENAMPVMMADDTLKAEGGNLHGVLKNLQDKFPGLAPTNPKIQELENTIKKIDVVDSPTAMLMLRQLRSEATANMTANMKNGDPAIGALGLAQRKAAQAIEDAMERNVQNAPEYLQKIKAKLTAENQKANAMFGKAAEMRAKAKAYGSHAPELQSVEAATPAADKMEADARALLEKNHAMLATIDEKAATLGSADERAHLLDRMRVARQRIAKSHDIETALSPTGEINPRRIAALAKNGRPLTGGLKEIADAAWSFPKEFQAPSSFGGAENFSILDVLGGTAAAGMGHPGVAATILARPLARATVLSAPWQNSMMGIGREAGQGSGSPDAVNDLIGGGL